MDNQQLFMTDLKNFIGFQEGVITIINFDEEEYSKKNLKNVIATCKCSKCGKIFKINLSKIKRSVHCFKNCCPNCKQEYRKEQIIKRLTGVTHGVLTFIDFDHFEGTRAFIKCKCSRCGKITVVRDDKLIGKYKPSSCEHCYSEFTGEQVKLRAQINRNLFGEEYKKDKEIRNRIQSLKYGAKTRHLKFELTDFQARNLLEQECYYCGSKEYIGIDRLDSNKNYTLDNTVSCCKYCNLMKNNLQYDLFLTQINKIFKYRINNSTTIENTSKDGSELSTFQVNGNGNAEDPKGS